MGQRQYYKVVLLPDGSRGRELVTEEVPDEVLAAELAERTIVDRARQALGVNAAFLALGSPTNAQVLAQVRVLTRECSGLIRLLLRELSTADDT